MPRWTRTSTLIALSIALMAGCQAAPDGKQAAQIEEPAPQEAAGGLADSANEAPRARMAAKPAAPGQEAPSQKEKPADPQSPQAGRYIIRSANVSLQVKDVRQAMTRVQEVAGLHRGFISDSSLEAGEGQTPTASLTIRVPAARFDQALNALGGVGVVRARQVSGQDVTVELVDTDARVRNLKREEAELLKLLSRAGRLSEVLEVERELSRVRGQIEQAQGRLRQLSSQVDLATIQVSLAESVQQVTTSPWQLGPVAENAWANAQRELAATVAAVIAGLIWFVAFVLPVGLPALLLFLFVGWALRRWLVDRRELVPGKLYDRAWAAVGVALLAIAFPPLFGLIAVVAVIAVVIWLGSRAVRSFGGKTAYKD
ncbi:MAG: DUF4349 domain-containing protein [Candidatus Sericytochromatia bacterium]